MADADDIALKEFRDAIAAAFDAAVFGIPLPWDQPPPPTREGTDMPTRPAAAPDPIEDLDPIDIAQLQADADDAARLPLDAGRWGRVWAYGPDDPDDLEAAEWLMDKLAERRHRATAVHDIYQARIDRLTARRAEVLDPLQDDIIHLEGVLERWALAVRRETEGRTKSVKLAHGTVSTRPGRDTVTIRDLEKAAAFVEAAGGTIKRTVTVTALKKVVNDAIEAGDLVVVEAADGTLSYVDKAEGDRLEFVEPAPASPTATVTIE